MSFLKISKVLNSFKTAPFSRRYFTVKTDKGLIALIMGPPGGGKGTISKKILKDFEFNHISTGDVLRANVINKTQLGLEAKSFMDQGAYVPDALMIALVKAEIESVSSAAKPNMLLDGFPRTVAQAEALQTVAAVDLVLNLEVPHETIVARLAGRWLHPGSGRVYAYDYNPPSKLGFDDVTGEPLVQREDDQPHVVRARLKKYEDLTLPVLEFYQRQKKLQTFCGTESDVIYPQVKQFLENVFR